MQRHWWIVELRVSPQHAPCSGQSGRHIRAVGGQGGTSLQWEFREAHPCSGRSGRHVPAVGGHGGTSSWPSYHDKVLGFWRQSGATGGGEEH